LTAARDPDGEHPVVARRLDLFEVDVFGQPELAIEADGARGLGDDLLVTAKLYITGFVISGR
jgi:hypothetical protein